MREWTGWEIRTLALVLVALLPPPVREACCHVSRAACYNSNKIGLLPPTPSCEPSNDIGEGSSPGRNQYYLPASPCRHSPSAPIATSTPNPLTTPTHVNEINIHLRRLSLRHQRLVLRQSRLQVRLWYDRICHTRPIPHRRSLERRRTRLGLFARLPLLRRIRGNTFHTEDFDVVAVPPGEGVCQATMSVGLL